MPDTHQLTEREAERLLITMRYQRLHQMAYGYPPSPTQVAGALELYQNLMVDASHALEDVVDETYGLAEVCDDTGIPKWMMAGAPNPETHHRWLVLGLI